MFRRVAEHLSALARVFVGDEHRDHAAFRRRRIFSARRCSGVARSVVEHRNLISLRRRIQIDVAAQIALHHRNHRAAHRFAALAFAFD